MKIGDSIERARIKILLAQILLNDTKVQNMITSFLLYTKISIIMIYKTPIFLSIAINQGLKTKFIQLLGYAIPAPRPSQNNWSPKHGQLDFSKVSDSISNFNIP